MSFPTLSDAISAARFHLRSGRPLEDYFEYYQVELAWQADIRDAVQPKKLIDETEEDSKWTSRLTEDDWFYWKRLYDYLVHDKGWEINGVDSIAHWSEKILARMPDPITKTFRSQGLVIGYVQAGKTANYTALSARAADAGYRFIIILSGIHVSLRQQAQDRLDQELTGEAEVGVGKPEYGRQWYRITQDFDFPDTIGTEILQASQPKLAVVKKTCNTLRKIEAWLKEADPEALKATPILIIDDEADQASVNTGDDRPPAEFDDTDADIEAEDDDTAPSKTNELIRGILKLIPRVSYVGYTATPFANVLIDPDSVDREVGRGLFPKDFILQLPRPKGYTGTRELFGDYLDEGKDVLRFVRAEERDQLRPRGRQRFRAEITESLVKAVYDFLFAGAIRLLRGQLNQPNTMLIHTTHQTAAQGQIVDKVIEFVQGIEGAWNLSGTGDGSLHNKLSIYWDEEYRFFPDGLEDVSFSIIEPHLAKVINSIEVLELNSVAGDELDYDRKGERQIIAVGGNRLSRGLTLEGLTVSYFLRTSTMADTLLQMGRWYGHRKGFDDLIRIYTTRQLASWFSEIAIIEEDLRDEIYRLNELGIMPDQVGVKIRRHSSLILTSRLKMKTGVTIRTGYSGSHPQTIVFPLDQKDMLDANIDLVRTNFDDLAFASVSEGGILARTVSPEKIISFVRNYKYAPETKTINKDNLANWIEEKVNAGYIGDWSVYVDSLVSRDSRVFQLGGHSLGMVNRSRLPQSHSIGTLVDPKHEGIDLPGGPDTYRRDNSFNAVRMREARDASSALLIIYPINPYSVPKKKNSGRTVLFDESWEKPETLIGFCLSFPHIDFDEGTEYVVGRKWA